VATPTILFSPSHFKLLLPYPSWYDKNINKINQILKCLSSPFLFFFLSNQTNPIKNFSSPTKHQYHLKIKRKKKSIPFQLILHANYNHACINTTRTFILTFQNYFNKKPFFKKKKKKI
jgi:hypothetical protein